MLYDSLTPTYMHVFIVQPLYLNIGIHLDTETEHNKVLCF